MNSIAASSCEAGKTVKRMTARELRLLSSTSVIVINDVRFETREKNSADSSCNSSFSFSSFCVILLFLDSVDGLYPVANRDFYLCLNHHSKFKTFGDFRDAGLF